MVLYGYNLYTVGRGADRTDDQGERTMSTNGTKLQQAAGEAYEWFEKRTRNDGREFWTWKDNAPQWVKDLAHHAHGDMGPDDWRYEFIVEALAALHDNEDPDSIDMEADIYTDDLCAWLASDISRPGYCDDAVEELGQPEGIVPMMQYGQYEEKREVLYLVRSWLE
jgi:hypothetical protein